MTPRRDQDIWFSVRGETETKTFHNSTRQRRVQDVRFSVRDETKTLLG